MYSTELCSRRPEQQSRFTLTEWVSESSLASEYVRQTLHCPGRAGQRRLLLDKQCMQCRVQKAMSGEARISLSDNNIIQLIREKKWPKKQELTCGKQWCDIIFWSSWGKLVNEQSRTESGTKIIIEWELNVSWKLKIEWICHVGEITNVTSVTWMRCVY